MPNLTPWQPGQSGNPAGRPKNSLLDDILRERLAKDGCTAAYRIADQLLQDAELGDLNSIKLIANRTQPRHASASELRELINRLTNLEIEMMEVLRRSKQMLERNQQK
ncbi:MAG: hypothetical protein JO041_04930 [Acidobacteria bacterium]|nr:hypothetical protein [Acidobacteriota bacterium]